LRRDAENIALIVSAKDAVAGFADEINRLRELLLRGEYSEPPVVSTMVWKAATPQSNLPEIPLTGPASDNSGIAIDPEVKPNGCRLPRNTALELYKPFHCCPVRS
jgi:hypothetical protein